MRGHLQFKQVEDATDWSEGLSIVPCFSIASCLALLPCHCRLFDDDTDLNQGVFAETLRQQHLNELLDFFGGVEEVSD